VIHLAMAFLYLVQFVAHCLVLYVAIDALIHRRVNAVKIEAITESGSVVVISGGGRVVRGVSGHHAPPSVVIHAD